MAEPELSAPRPEVRIKPNGHGRLARGHPWLFSNEIEMDPETRALPPGGVVRLVRADGKPAGTAMFNPRTLIAARLLTPDPFAEIGTEFLAGRLRRALALRERLFDAPFYRLVHAEADGLPGLVIDRFGDVLVVQENTAGMDRLEGPLLEALDAAVAPSAVLLRNDTPARQLEGLPLDTRMAKGALDGPIRLEENGAAFFIEPLGGQKTGWFYDHRVNRAFVASLSAGARVLDLYCYAGAFSIPCARAGARSVLGIDRSEAALALASRAAEANGVAERCRFERAEVFGLLERFAASGERFDVVIADPPAFIKSRKDLAAGLRGYRKLARLAASVVAPGGFLLAASCSHHAETSAFAAEVARGLSEAGRTGRILRTSGAGPDHPVHPFLPESAYLKALTIALD